MQFKLLLKYMYQIIYKMIRRDCVFEQKIEFGFSCIFKGANKISRGSFLMDTEIGYGSYIGYDCNLTSVLIGKYSSIGSFVKTYVGKHPVAEFVSTHPAFYAIDHPCKLQYVHNQKFTEVEYAYNHNGKQYAVNIGNDVWIGAGTAIADGVTIGDGAIVGANSLVMDNVEPYTIVVGTPARMVRKRFSDEKIKELLEIKWWDRDIEWIKRHAEYFENIEVLLENIN